MPNKIYIQPSTIDELPRQNIVYTKQLSDASIEYIRKDALLKKLNRAIELRIKSGADKTSDGVMTLNAIIKYIESL